MSGEIGWTTIAEADAYFSTRLSSTAWTGLPVLSGDPTKTAALMTAYDRLFYSGLFNLPTFAGATAAQLVILQKAQCEMALYMLLHIADEDRRKGLQTQGVTVAGIIKEQYAEADLMKLPVPAFVSAMLDEAGFSAAPAPFYISDIDRDEEKGANEDVTDF